MEKKLTPIPCPHCKKNISIDVSELLSGNPVDCPNCKTRLQLKDDSVAKDTINKLNDMASK